MALGLLVVTLAAGTLAQQSARSAAGTPDTIFVNGKVVTVDRGFSIHQAFAVTGETFAAVGTNARIRALARADTRIVDLRGATVIPGLADNHDHVFDSAKIMQRGINLEGAATVADVLARIRQGMAAAPPGTTVFTSVMRIPPSEPAPTRQDLDQISRTVPIVLVRGRRGNATLNTAALTRVGVSRDRPVYDGQALPTDASGELTGLTPPYPANMRIVDSLLPPMTEADEDAMLLKAIAGRHALGLTSVRDLSLLPRAMRTYFRLWQRKQLTLRVSMGLDIPDVKDAEETLRAWGVGSGFGDTWLRFDSVSEDPYPMLVPPKQFAAAVLLAQKYGWRMSPHADADDSLDAILDAYEAADRVSSIKDQRWVIEHVPLVTPQQIQRMVRLRVVISSQFSAWGQDLSAATAAAGRERAERQPPVRALLDAGLVVSAGSDYFGPTMNVPDNPFIPIYFYVTRRARSGKVIGPDQKISREQALRVSTVNYAYTTFEEGVKGSIEPGKLADFLILSGDVLTVPEDQIMSLHPLATYVGGRQVFAAPGGGFEGTVR
jgi:predicted amidohydrolase YtcJ